MTIEEIPTQKLVPYARNSRSHSEEQIAKVAASLKEFGFTNPILIDADNVIIAGHCRLAAAQRLELATVPVIRLEHLTEAQKRAYVIADNRLALDSDWDYEMLASELRGITEDFADYDLSTTGFEAAELAAMLTEPDFAAGTEDDQSQLDELSPKIVACPNCGKNFDLREQEQQ